MDRASVPTSRLGLLLLAVAVTRFGAAADQPAPNAASPAPLSVQQVQRVVADYFSQQDRYRPGDIISQTEVAAVLEELAAAGWQPHDRQQILADTLPDDNTVVSLLRTKKGRRFMGEVSDYDLIYDRIDRVSRVWGGARMIDAIIRLPDGEKYSRPAKQTPYGVPDFLDLLPKNASGKVRSIKDYYKPTGRIYTEVGLVKRLSRSLEGPTEAETGKSSASRVPGL